MTPDICVGLLQLRLSTKIDKLNLMEIIPTILGRSEQEVRDQTTLLEALVSRVHIDVMDGQFVPEVTPMNLSELMNPSLQYDVHCMVTDPAVLMHHFQQEHVRFVFAHAELSQHTLVDFFESATGFNISCGLALNLETDTDIIANYADRIAAILLMSIAPGDSGRPFDQRVIQKIALVKQRFPDLYVAVDGGINSESILLVSAADAVLVHSALFNYPGQEAEKLAELQLIAQNV